MKRLLQRVAGIDGCKSGWLIVETTIDLGVQDWRIVPEWNTIDSKADVLAVDMPIGLSVSGVRQCDVDARRVISPCGSRVFKAPPREALRFTRDEWATANQWSKRNKFGGLSRQIWNICPRIREIDRAISPQSQTRIREAHPELAFARLNGGRPLASKHEAGGRETRIRLLAKAGFSRLDAWLADLRGSGAKPDDLLDACALVLTARHILLGTAHVLPEHPPRDQRGLEMSISY